MREAELRGIGENGGPAITLGGFQAARSATTRTIAGVLMLAVSPASLAMAQSSQSSEQLPPIVVEGQKAKPKKKPVAAKKAPAPKQAKQAAPAPAPQPAAEPVEAAAGGQGSADPSANPYSNPDAPYKVERSGSTKLTQPLVDTPRTVTAVSKEVIEDRGATDLRELARQTPGVTIVAGENGASAGSNFQIRGFNARNDIFVDGIRDPGNIGRDVFSIDQLEVYKGPSGSIAGRATPGGAFNFITKQSVLGADFYEVDTTVGTDETFRTTIDANKSFTRDFAARANLMYHESEVAGRDFTEDERWGGLLSAAARPSDNVLVELDYYRYRRDGMPDNGVPVSRTERVPFTELGLPRDTFYGQLNLDHIVEESDVGTAKVIAKVAPGITVTNITRYGENLSDYISTAARPQPGQDDINGDTATGSGSTNVSVPRRYTETELFANQLSANAKFNTGSVRHEVIAGIDYSNEQIDRAQQDLVFAPGVPNSHVPILNPDPNRTTRIQTGRTNQFSAEVENIGYYIGDTVHLTDQWIFNAGVRWDDYSRDQVGGPGQEATLTARTEDTLFSWNVGLVYKPVPIGSIYVAYGTAESPIGNETDSTGIEYNGLTAANQNLEPEEARGVEVGTKWELFNRRMLATAAVFETIKDNARTNSGAPPVGGGNKSDGEYRIRGVEFGLSGNITDKWSVFGGAVFVDTEVLDSDNPNEIGRGLANTPDVQFALFTKYQLTPQLAVGGQAIYQDKVWSGHFAINDNFYRTVDYWRFDAMAEYEFNDNWSVEVSGINLTDELYYDSIYQAANTFATVAPGRAGYLSVKWKY